MSENERKGSLFKISVRNSVCITAMRKFSSIQYLELSLTCFHVGCLDCGFPVNEVDTTNSTPHSHGTKESLETLEERKKQNPPSHLNVVVYNQNHGAVSVHAFFSRCCTQSWQFSVSHCQGGPSGGCSLIS